MEIRYQISGVVEVPEGSIIEGPRAIRLPDGNIIRLWTGVELNEVDDLTFAQQQIRGIDVQDNDAVLEEI